MNAGMSEQDDKGAIGASSGLRINVIVLSAAFILLLAILAVAAILAVRQNRAQADVRDSIEVINSLNRIQSGLLDAETGQRGYILTGNPSYLDRIIVPRRIFWGYPAATADGLKPAGGTPRR